MASLVCAASPPGDSAYLACLTFVLRREELWLGDFESLAGFWAFILSQSVI